MKSVVRNALILSAGAIAASLGLLANHISVQAAPTPSAATLFTKSFPDSTGKPFAMSALKGHVVVVNFWATWCVPCVKEIPELSKMSDGYGKKVEFVGIGVDSASNIADFQAKAHAAYPLLVAQSDGSDLIREFGDNAGGLPFTMVIDANGVVKATKLGPIDVEELKAWLKPLT